MQSKAEKWDYIITGRPYGIMRMVIVGALAAFFIVLTIDQLQRHQRRPAGNLSSLFPFHRPQREKARGSL